ncbi:MAG: hypothetical protein JNL08_02875 [Planctomycetes bacterium]|nr:hypothetical protein [Planctomycetota bacterium]
MPIRQGAERLRVEVADGLVQIDRGESGQIQIRGGVRRAADTAEQLAVLEQTVLAFTAEPDAGDPRVLVVRGPRPPAGAPLGVFALEVGIRLPADLPVELVIAGSGDVVVANRQAPTKVATGRGDLRFENCQGGLAGRTGRGNVIAYGSEGDVDLHAKAGEMQVFVPVPGASLRLVTGQGTVQCHVPRGLDFEIDARAETGVIRATAFDLEEQRVGRFGAVLTGVRGSGRTKIVLRTGSGHLSLSPIDG